MNQLNHSNGVMSLFSLADDNYLYERDCCFQQYLVELFVLSENDVLSKKETCIMHNLMRPDCHMLLPLQTSLRKEIGICFCHCKLHSEKNMH